MPYWTRGFLLPNRNTEHLLILRDNSHQVMRKQSQDLLAMMGYKIFFHHQHIKRFPISTPPVSQLCRLNRMGPRTDLCGTPNSTYWVSEHEVPTLTGNVWLERTVFIHFSNSLLTPACSSLSKRHLWEIRSKDFSKSTYTTSSGSDLSKWDVQMFKHCSKQATTDFLGRKPCWFIGIMLCVFRNCRSCFWTIRSMILTQIQVKLIGR